MYIKNKLTEKDYQDIAQLMRSLMVKFKIKYSDKVIKEISMPDMMDILCRFEYIDISSEYVVNKYWDQIKEEHDSDIEQQLYVIFRNNCKTVKQLYGCEPFTQNELQWIINNYIKDIPVIYIKEED